MIPQKKHSISQNQRISTRFFSMHTFLELTKHLYSIHHIWIKEWKYFTKKIIETHEILGTKRKPIINYTSTKQSHIKHRLHRHLPKPQRTGKSSYFSQPKRERICHATVSRKVAYGTAAAMTSSVSFFVTTNLPNTTAHPMPSSSSWGRLWCSWWCPSSAGGPSTKWRTPWRWSLGNSRLSTPGRATGFPTGRRGLPMAMGVSTSTGTRRWWTSRIRPLTGTGSTANAGSTSIDRWFLFRVNKVMIFRWCIREFLFLIWEFFFCIYCRSCRMKFFYI